MNAISSSTIPHHHLPVACRRPGTNQLSLIRARQEVVAQPQAQEKATSRAARLANSLSNLLHLHLETPLQKNLQYTDWNFLDQGNRTSPTTSPREDIQGKLEPIGDGDGDVKVEHGFLNIYTSKSESTRYNKSSASEQVMKEVRRLVSLYKQNGESITRHFLSLAEDDVNPLNCEDPEGLLSPPPLLGLLNFPDLALELEFPE
ncbi:hypothetical protein HHK36_004892 [Tetracentron sinense]|uniref:Uncharacterized protein n=1 Tax=Tetracentron sinense TaxID=13715 RepID=A0A835DLY6_TETSI|nr:hypothetical protein HHK36_004892 [Tetracentron sinense]